MRPDDLIGIFIVLMTAGIILFAVSRGLHLTSELSETWRKLAERHRLRFSPGRRLVGMPSAEGRLEGRHVHIKTVHQSDKSYAAQLQVELHGSLPPHFYAGAPSPAVAMFGKTVAGQTHTTGHASFDEQVSIRGEDPEETSAYLTEARRQAALELIELEGRVEDGKLQVQLKKAGTDLERIDKTLQALVKLAPALDAAPSSA